jgi:hypothetical protein
MLLLQLGHLVSQDFELVGQARELRCPGQPGSRSWSSLAWRHIGIFQQRHQQRCQLCHDGLLLCNQLWLHCADLIRFLNRVCRPQCTPVGKVSTDSHLFMARAGTEAATLAGRPSRSAQRRHHQEWLCQQAGCTAGATAHPVLPAPLRLHPLLELRVLKGQPAPLHGAKVRLDRPRLQWRPDQAPGLRNSPGSCHLPQPSVAA